MAHKEHFMLKNGYRQTTPSKQILSTSLEMTNDELYDTVTKHSGLR